MPSVVTRVPVDDPADPRLTDYRDLTTADRRPDRPGGRGLVIAEGVVVVRRLIASAYPVRSLLGVPRRLDELASDLAGLDVPAYSAEPTRWRAPSASISTAACSPSPTGQRRSTRASLARGARLLAVTEGVNDHENLGSLFRNAAALGVDGVLLGPRCADPLYRRSVRVSMGHVLRVPFAELPGEWPRIAGRAAGGRVAGRRADAGARRAAARRGRAGRGAHRAAARCGGSRV